LQLLAVLVKDQELSSKVIEDFAEKAVLHGIDESSLIGPAGCVYGMLVLCGDLIHVSQYNNLEI
jgi:DNA-binding transcriptional regulator GbsR (MarR family)